MEPGIQEKLVLSMHGFHCVFHPHSVKKVCLCGPMQLKTMLFKGQLYFSSLLFMNIMQTELFFSVKMFFHGCHSWMALLDPVLISHIILCHLEADWELSLQLHNPLILMSGTSLIFYGNLNCTNFCLLYI